MLRKMRANTSFHPEAFRLRSQHYCKFYYLLNGYVDILREPGKIRLERPMPTAKEIDRDY